ncbi:MAG: helix-turn-helix domain-containing protein [Rickettsiales endosymbiont of Dermacentor nuttalli]
MSAIGNLLREKRLEKKLSLEEVSEKTKVRIFYLSAIEENSNREGIPSPVYMLGYLKIYSDFLGLDGKQIVNQLKSEIELSSLSFPSNYKDDHKPNFSTLLISILFLILSYSFYYIIENEYNIFNNIHNPFIKPKEDLSNSSSILFLDQILKNNIIENSDSKQKVIILSQSNDILTIFDSQGNLIKKINTNIGDIYQVSASNKILLTNNKQKLITLYKP